MISGGMRETWIRMNSDHFGGWVGEDAVDQTLERCDVGGRSEHTKRAYVGVLLAGTSWRWMKSMVSVPWMRPPTPWARRPNSLAAERCHTVLVRSVEMSWRYSRAFPVSGSMTALANSVGVRMAGDWRTLSTAVELGAVMAAHACWRELVQDRVLTINRGSSVVTWANSVWGIGRGGGLVGLDGLLTGFATLGAGAAGLPAGCPGKVRSKMAANWVRASVSGWPSGAKGVAGCGCWRAWISSRAARRVASAEERRGIGTRWGWKLTAVASVVFHGGADVPGGFAVHRPAGAVGGFDMFDGLGSGRGQWCAVEIEGTVELREDGEVRVGGAETCHEVVFEGPDGSFGGIATMDSRWGQLEVDVFLADVFLENGAGFIVKALELGSESAGYQEGVKLLVGSQVFGGCLVEERFGEDRVAVKIVEDHDVAVAGEGVVWEGPSLVGCDLACFLGHRDQVGIDFMGVATISDWTISRIGGRGDWFGGLDVFALLVQVSHVGGNGFGEVAGDVGNVEAGPGGKVALADGFEER
eukprot:scaffold5_cov98-Cylindrotheca_fusiformis.AAC.4